MWNPFDWLYYWCKGEIYDLKSLVTAIDQLNGLEKMLRKANVKKLETANDLGNMQEGKTTIRTVFKSSSDTGSMKAAIETTEREIENLGILCEIITVHLGRDVLPAFKTSKAGIYRKML
jgi:hypothetical protein